MTIGERIRERRKALGYTQKQLGKLCGGMADSAIRKYESGKITPKRSTLVKIAHALQVPLWALSDDDLEIDTDGSGGGNMKKVFRMAYKWESMVPATADIVEVVRCKDCRWRKNGSLCYMISGCGVPVGTADDFFCSFGERKDNERLD